MTTQEWVRPDQWITPTLPIGPRPAWVKGLGRYGRSAYEWNRRHPVIQLREQYYLDLQVWVETEVQALMEEWESLEPDSEQRWDRFGIGELITDHPLELRMVMEPGVCRRLVFQPVPDDWREAYPRQAVTESEVGMLTNTGSQDEDHEIQTLIWKADKHVEYLIQMWEDYESLESGLEWFMPTAGEIVLSAINNDSRMIKEDLQIQQYSD